MSIAVAALVLSLMGSVHCMGMCGGFALLAQSGARRWSVSAPFLSYSIGKTLTYAVAGLVFGALGTTVHAFPIGSRVLAWLVGLVLIWVGTEMAGVNVLSGRLSSKPGGWMVAALGRTATTPTPGSRFLMGLLNGLLPCGLLYAAFAGAAATGNAVSGMLFMAVFGLGTLPALYISGNLLSSMSSSRRLVVSRLAGWLLVAFGIITMFRGAVPMVPGMH